MAEAIAISLKLLGGLGKLFTVFIVGGMGIGVIVNGINSSSITDAKSQIEQLVATNNSMKEKLTNTNKKIIDMDIDTQNEYKDLLAKYIDMKDQIKTATFEFNKTLKDIQIRGIIVAIIVFFLLLLKQFDLFDTIQSIILYPFIYIYNSIVNIIQKK